MLGYLMNNRIGYIDGMGYENYGLDMESMDME